MGSFSHAAINAWSLLSISWMLGNKTNHYGSLLLHFVINVIFHFWQFRASVWRLWTLFFIMASGIIQGKQTQQPTWRPESIHRKVQWSSMARGAHGGMISEPLWVRKTGRALKAGQLFWEKWGTVFPLRSTGKAPVSSRPLPKTLAASADARLRLLNKDFMLMCEVDNIARESRQENSTEGRADDDWFIFVMLINHIFSTD